MTPKRIITVAPWLIIAVVVAAALIVGAHRSARPASLSDQARTIAAGVRCPTCQGETAAESPVFAAKAIRSEIADRLHAGQSPAQIKAYLVSRYGPGILESPPTSGISALVWIVPVVVVPFAAIALVVGFRRSARRHPPRGQVTDADRALVDHALRPQSSLTQAEDLVEQQRKPATGRVRTDETEELDGG